MQRAIHSNCYGEPFQLVLEIRLGVVEVQFRLIHSKLASQLEDSRYTGIAVTPKIHTGS